MANYPAEFPTEQGIIPTPRTASASDTVPGGVILDITNGNASTCVVTIVTPVLVAGDLTVLDRAISILTTANKYIYIPNNSTYVDPVTGLVTVQFSVFTSVTYYVVGRS
jgi:hypothetical protein